MMRHQLTVHIPKTMDGAALKKAWRVIASYAIERGTTRGEYLADLILRESKRIEKRRAKR